MKKSFIIILGLALVSLGVYAFAFGKKDAPRPETDQPAENQAADAPADAAPNAAPAPTVVVAPVTEIQGEQARKFASSITAIEEVDVVPRVTGYIESINFKEGDLVHEGDVLFQVEEREYIANLKKAQANVESCKSEILQLEAQTKQQEARIVELDAILKYKQTTYNRNKELYARGKAASQDDVDNSESSLQASQAQKDAAVATLAAVRSQWEAAKSALEAAEALCDLADFDMSHTHIKAHITGKIGKVSVTRGNLITPQSGKLVDIKQISPIYVKFAISERLFRSIYGGESKIKEKARVQLSLADDSIYPEEAEISFIDNKIDPKTNTIMIWATLKNEDHQLLPGSYATVLLSPKSDKRQYGVLLSAIQNDKDGNFVYVLNAENKAVRRNVTLGEISGNYYKIETGVDPSETVVVDGMNKIGPDGAVNPIPYGEEENSPKESK